MLGGEGRLGKEREGKGREKAKTSKCKSIY